MARHMLGDETSTSSAREIERNVEAINHATRDIPPDAMRMHLCWGNYEGPHHHDVPLARHHRHRARGAARRRSPSRPPTRVTSTSGRVFEDIELPEGKVLIPGVLDSTTNYIEHPELVAQRLVRYAQLVGRENVIAGTDCGFATFASFLTVDPAITWAKLARDGRGRPAGHPGIVGTRGRRP